MGSMGDGPVLVTGAGGFLGSHAAQRLLERGTHVLGIDNFDSFYARARKELNLNECRRAADASGVRFDFIESDLLDAGALADAFTRWRPAGVLHFAARAGVRPSLADPAGYFTTNVVGTSRVLEAATRAGVSRVVCASSSSVYGDSAVVPFREDQGVDQPISPYAASKRAMELLCSTHHHLTRLPIACLRFFTVYGPRQRPDLAIATFMDRVDRGEAIRMFGSPESSRDYTYVDDIIDGVLAAYGAIAGHGFRVWNLGGSRPVTLARLIESIERVVGKRASVERVGRQAGDVERTYADLSRSRDELGFSPKVPFEDGLSRQWAWMRATR